LSKAATRLFDRIVDNKKLMSVDFSIEYIQEQQSRPHKKYKKKAQKL